MLARLQQRRALRRPAVCAGTCMQLSCPPGSHASGMACLTHPTDPLPSPLRRRVCASRPKTAGPRSRPFIKCLMMWHDPSPTAGGTLPATPSPPPTSALRAWRRRRWGSLITMLRRGWTAPTCQQPCGSRCKRCARTRRAGLRCGCGPRSGAWCWCRLMGDRHLLLLLLALPLWRRACKRRARKRRDRRTSKQAAAAGRQAAAAAAAALRQARAS